ncbi:hypothetical protein ACQCT4_04915 [Metabacillus indicus]
MTRKAEPTVKAWPSDKKSPEKSGFDFFGDFVLTEGLGGAAGQKKSGIARLASGVRKGNGEKSCLLTLRYRFSV